MFVTSLDGGGFTARSQTSLVTLAAFALIAAALTDPRAVQAGVRSPLVLALLLLGVVALVSAAWTVGSPSTAARWGLVIVAYAVLAVASAALVARVGVWPIAVALAVLAGIEAVLGLRAALAHSLPDAERLAGTWRPGGSYQYPPALGLLQVAALPILLSGLVRQWFIAVPAAVGATLAGAVLGCANSRLDLALGAIVLACAVLWPSRGVPRSRVLAAVALIVIAGLAGHLLIGRHVTSSHRSARPAVVIRSDFTHGRFEEWKVAVQTWLDRPVLGAGTGAYYQASAVHQGAAHVLFAHNLLLELAAELGMIGFALGVLIYAATIDLLRRARGRPELWLLGPFLAAFLIANLLDWPWHLAGLGAAWAVAAGGLIRASFCTLDSAPG